MANSDTRSQEDVTLFLNKLDLLLDKLRVQYTDGTFSTQEEVYQEFLRVMDEFYSKLTEPFLRLRPVVKGTPPVLEEYNDLFSEINIDLDVVFKEINRLETIVARNFNFTQTEEDRLNKMLRRINSKIGDYILFNEDPIGDAIYFKDSYNDATRTELGSSFLTKPECEIHSAEGIATLPAKEGAGNTLLKAKVTLNSPSNGSVGNYQQLGASPHDDIEDILDANPDTWFEYEKVQRVRTNNDTPLNLDVTLYFDEPKVINFIRINPNNFGTQTPVSIKRIDTSMDGEVWTSVKDDIPISGWLSEDEENVFTLAPSTNKFAGQGLYTFTPRKVKYVNVLLEQRSAYIINTTSGEQWRYAIGLRDIELHAVKYDPDGDLISQPFHSSLEIQKVSLLASENPAFVSELADIKHQVSLDDGGTWFDIQPQHRVSTEIPEILEVNTGTAGAISTEVPAYSIRHRILMNRVASEFKEGSSTFQRTVKNGYDLLGIPSLSPLTLALTRSPLPDTLSLMNPLWSVRKDSVGTLALFKRFLGIGNGIPGMRFQTPLEFSSGEIERGEVVVWVDNDNTWSYVGQFQAGAAPAGTDGLKVFTLDERGMLQFGDPSGTDPDTDQPAIPRNGALISYSLTPEQLQPSASNPHTCRLVFPSDGEKANFNLYYLAAEETDTERLAAGNTIHRLKHPYIIDTRPTATFGTALGMSEVDYIDGNVELSSGNYSVDYTHGVIYTDDPISKTAVVNVTYSYTPRVEITEDQWDFLATPDNFYDKISIHDEAYDSQDISTTISALDSAPSTGEKIIDLGYVRIVPGSLAGMTSTVLGSSPYEVPFQNGAREFLTFGGEVNLSGHYSVDYRNGKIYLGGTLASTSATLSFKYTSLFAEYHIARPVDKKEYTLNTTDNSISISEREALRVWGPFSDAQSEVLLKGIYDYVETTRESIEELEPYFSPILRDYALKILPKGAF